ncbi:MAG: amidohydrolase family protein [Firmicutes bacterium]|nr:amidohydrolase family protein [Bacillota bacterium]
MLLKNCRLRDGSIVDILTRDEKIAEVEAGLEAEGVRVLDCRENLIVPGFVDCHMHLDKTRIAQETPNKSGTLNEAISISQSRKRNFTKDEVMKRARKTVEMAIEAGTTFIRTNVDVDPIVGLIGLEALLAVREEFEDRLQLQLVAFPQEGILKAPGTLQLLEEALKMGADAVGGIPAKDTSAEEHLQIIFDLAEKHDRPLDIHTDESDDPQDLTILEIAKQTVARGLQGRVSVAHCCSLAALPPERLERVLAEIRPADLHIVSLPSTNLYLQGRDDAYKVRRGIAPVKILLEKGFRVAVASDNVRDAFNPFGNANLLQIALITAHGCHLGGTDELEQVFDMISSTPREMMGLNPHITPGGRADFTILPTENVAEAIVGQVRILDRIYKGVPDGRWL